MSPETIAARLTASLIANEALALRKKTSPNALIFSDVSRRLIAIAGPPASGKSTLAAALCQRLQDAGYGAGLLAMDGFHLDNRLLAPRGLLPRKGAPATFDLAGFKACLHRLKSEPDVFVPVFERSQEQAIAAAAHIRRDDRLVIVEGNYLLLDALGWRDLAPLWDYRVFLNVPLKTLRTRLQNRWDAYGLSEAEAERKCTDNDLPNAATVTQNQLPADETITVA